MLKSGIYNPKLLFWSKLISIIFSPFYLFYNFFRPSYSFNKKNIRTVLITEYHRIGDVIIIIPALKMIRKTFNNAKIVLLCNRATYPLADYLNIADEVIPYDVPWTDWNWSIKKWLHARLFAKGLSKRNFDLAFDFKGDIRNSWFLWNIKPKISFGYSATGGAYFFTHPNEMNQKIHQSYRAIELANLAGCDESLLDGKIRLNNDLGYVVIHIGASDPKRKWPIKCWVKLVKLLSVNLSINIVRTVESEVLIKRLNDEGLHPNYFEGNLVELTNWLKNQKCLIAPDSMAGHLAAHIGIPVVSIFGSQPKNLTRPLGKSCVVVSPDILCNHRPSHWRLCPKCIGSVNPNKVELAVYSVI
tara:strand:+ start:5475 stop:6548 length:1074 start_codon:yes stop_codon:yes gene_type:complete